MYVFHTTIIYFPQTTAKGHQSCGRLQSDLSFGRHDRTRQAALIEEYRVMFEAGPRAKVFQACSPRVSAVGRGRGKGWRKLRWSDYDRGERFIAMTASDKK